MEGDSFEAMRVEGEKRSYEQDFTTSQVKRRKREDSTREERQKRNREEENITVLNQSWGERSTTELKQRGSGESFSTALVKRRGSRECDNSTQLKRKRSREKDTIVAKEGESRKGDNSRQTKKRGAGEEDTCMDVEKRRSREEDRSPVRVGRRPGDRLFLVGGKVVTRPSPPPHARPLHPRHPPWTDTEPLPLTALPPPPPMRPLPSSLPAPDPPSALLPLPTMAMGVRNQRPQWQQPFHGARQGLAGMEVCTVTVQWIEVAGGTEITQLGAALLPTGGQVRLW